jgi:hypothetical protein
VLCHCLTCRKLTGSAYTTSLLIPSNNFTILSGSENLKSYIATHETGLKFTLHFCQKCGTKIYKVNQKDSEVYIVQAGTLDGGDAGMGLGDVKLVAELWVGHRVGWLEEMKGLAQLKAFPEG